ncbi:hypothetical protein EUGRSUZ_J00082 [Eucalyptus grandis]|uniref:Uncharacterized protein n=2 Tax=Eucalyptus grandis TaxID=71139 RepID=A0ACC3J2K3_EUCGR|nr:hypothetical protein EUGRSUZ_J00082 [Eucalyptus grandis]
MLVVLLATTLHIPQHGHTQNLGKTKKTQPDQCHLGLMARGTTSESGVASGVGAGELRHSGHVALTLSHASTQAAWKQWLHSGTHRMTSLASYSAKHIEQCPPSLCFGSLLLSPSTSFG